MKQEKCIMGNHNYKSAEFLFFGAGRQGRFWLEYSKNWGIVPKGIIDNNLELWGQQYENIMIYSPSALCSLTFACIFITCNKEEEIAEQLSELGVARDKIIVGWHNFLNHFLYFADYDFLFLKDTLQIAWSYGEEKILFDLQNGMVLGGVETWVYSIAKELQEAGYQGMYLTTDAADPVVADQTFPVCILKHSSLTEDKDKIVLSIKEIIKNLPCTIVCNFPQNIFWAACIVKRLYPDSIRIIAVQHSDDSLYYEAYGLWKEYVDKCLVISSRIEEKMLLAGVEKNKLSRLEWKIVCEEEISRMWRKGREPLQIGYAGRLTTISKRVDLLPVLAEKLRKRNIVFRINIAGTGEYEENLRQRIKEKNLEEYISLVGYIDRNNIPDFWHNQDIMVSCSEREGHSISQSEAMAEGAVPVITDVSGARDDVMDGQNGYIVPIGNMDALADRICYLYGNEDVLKQMGKQAHDTIYQRQRNKEQITFWKEVLEKIWQS